MQTTIQRSQIQAGRPAPATQKRVAPKASRKAVSVRASAAVAGPKTDKAIVEKWCVNDSHGRPNVMGTPGPFSPDRSATAAALTGLHSLFVFLQRECHPLPGH